MGFIHLHVHSQYSFHDGAATLDKLLERTKEFRMPALAITDHDRLTGVIRFYDKAREIGIKPIIGAEITLEGGHYLLLLCKDITGYSNLCRLITEAHLSHRDCQPYATQEMLTKFSSGLIALSGCQKGEIPTLLKRCNPEKAKSAADFYRQVYGEDFYIELFRYTSKEAMTLSFQLNAFAQEQGLRTVVTNNVHYINRRDYKIKELLNAIGQNIPVSQLKKDDRTMEQYLKSAEEMSELFKDFPHAIAATEEIASRCNVELPLGQPRFPKFTIPQGETSYSYLSKIAHAGALRKYETLTLLIKERLEMELETIRQLGFCEYFLVVWDIAQWAKVRGIKYQARGSAIDSLVVYVLDISTIDPIHYDLLFERFMHPLRREPPDIDLDIDRRRRDEVRDYIYQKYGTENVACVGTINTYMARGVIRDTGKALKIPKEIIEEICNGLHYLTVKGLRENANTLPELKSRKIYKNPYLQDFFRLCSSIDGFPKHMSVHLGGLLIGDGNLSDLVPLEWSNGGDIISQYDKDDIERLGVVKMDILALPTLTVIEDALTEIRRTRGVDIDISSIPRDDREVLAMLRDSKTIGVFQLESPAQREMAGRLLPDCFEDIIVSISLVRPGPLKSNMDKTYLPRRHGTEPVTYLHPSLKKALEETLGVILFQEQVLKVAHDLAGMSHAEADGFRRAMTHNRTEQEMEKMREAFISCAANHKVHKNIAIKVFEQLAAFAAYGFCKAHAVAYAVLAYQTLWLKCHYPAEFFAAILSNQPMGYYPPRVLIADARRFGVKVLPLDTNKSSDKYTVENGALRVGFKQLKGISDKEIQSILIEREQAQFTSLRDFILRTNVSQSTAENLIKVGAFNSLANSTELLLQLPGLLSLKRKTEYGQKALFEDTEEPGFTKATTVTNKEKMLAELKLLSLDLSAHPIDFYALGADFTKINDLPSVATGKSVKIAGSVIRYQTPPTRNGKRVVYIIMEDGTGVADVTVFSDIQEKCGQVLFRAGWLIVKGKIQRRGPKALSIIAQDLCLLTRWGKTA